MPSTPATRRPWTRNFTSPTPCCRARCASTGPTPGQHPADFFDTLKASGWASTRYLSKDPVLVSADKVHFVVTYTRDDVQGGVLSTHRNLWIATRVAGKWGISLRSY